MDAVRADRIAGLCIQLIGQRLFQQFAPLTGGSPASVGRHYHPLFAPIDVEQRAGIGRWYLQPPADNEPRLRLAQCAVFHGIGGQLVKRHGEDLHRGRPKGHVRRPVQSNTIQATADRVGMGFEDFKAAAATQIPVARVGEPDDIANAIAFFTGEAAGFVSGQVLYVAGGPVS